MGEAALVEPCLFLSLAWDSADHAEEPEGPAPARGCRPLPLVLYLTGFRACPCTLLLLASLQ